VGGNDHDAAFVVVDGADVHVMGAIGRIVVVLLPGFAEDAAIG